MNTLPSRAFHHDLIQNEFRHALTSSEHQVSPRTDGIVVLSAYEFETPADVSSPLDLSVPENAENMARISLGAQLVREVAASRTGKDAESLTPEDLLHNAPPLILNGTTTQLPIMAALASSLGFSSENAVRQVDCGPMGTANTKTQFEAMRGYVADSDATDHLTFVTSDYHVPRVKRTGNNNLPVDFDVVHVPHDQLPNYPVTRVVKGEVRRIGEYAAKGDISWHA
jgi:uncharacterized SAM-binding protein YcdF (DUF218 family)